MLKLLIISINLLLFTNIFSQQIMGDDTLCNGTVRHYWIDVPTGMSNIIWSLPQNSGSFFVSPNSDTIQVQWNSDFQRIISVSYTDPGGFSTLNKTIYLYPRPDPAISSSFDGGCGEIDLVREGDFPQPQVIGQQDIFNSCQIVCKNVPIKFYASGSSGSYFQWSIDNPAFVNITNYPNGDSIEIVFTNTTTTVGELYIFLEETSAQGCSEMVSFCVAVIENPSGTITSLTSIIANLMETCLNQEVTFSYTTNDDGLTESWYIYDYINPPVLFSAPNGHINPNGTADYLFDTPGDFQIILELTNQCGCLGYDTINVLVYSEEGPIIDACICPKCENDTTTFTTPSTCTQYTWGISGGHIIQGQNSDSITVVWDNIDATGMGTIQLECVPSNCPVPTFETFPIITNQATILGTTPICATKTTYTDFSVPFWQGTTYSWEISPPMPYSPTTTYFGHTINQPHNIVSFKIPPNYANQYTITVDYSHDLISCTGTDTFILDIKPEIGLSGEAIVCLGQAYKWFANPRTNDMNYTWQINGITATGFQGDSLVHTFNTAGIYNISISNPLYCNTKQTAVQILDIPPTPSAIQGETNVCLNFAYTYYTAPTSSEYYINWIINDGGSILEDQGSTITFQWHSTGPYILQAQQISNEGSCPSLTTDLIITPYAPDTPILNGPDTVCSNGTDSYYITNIEGNRIVFSDWELIYNSTNMGSFINKQDTVSEIQWANVIPLFGQDYSIASLLFSVTICGEEYFVGKNIYVGPPPNANLTISGGQCPDDNLSFTQTNTSISSGIYHWDFGDGNTLTTSSNNTIHSYNSGATYFVNLEVENPNGCLQTVSVTEAVNIYDKPVAAASIWSGNTTYCLPVNAGDINLTLSRVGQPNPSYTYYWYCSGTSQVPTLLDTIPTSINQSTFVVDCYNGSYSSATNLYAGIIAIDTNGCWNFDAIKIDIDSCNANGNNNCSNPPPMQLNLSFERDCNEVQLHASVTGNNSFIISSYWDFDKSPPAGSFLHNPPAYNYDLPGLYHPSFEISYYNADSLGNIDSSATCTMSGTLHIPIPMLVNFETRYVCNASGNIEIDWINLTEFVATTPTGEGTTITDDIWTITSANGTSNTYTNSLPPTTLTGGTYYVELTHYAHFVHLGHGINVTDTCSFADSIYVPTPAVANFEVDTNITCEDNTLFFTDLSTPQANINSWYWDFGDVTSSLLQHPAKSYANPTLPFQNKIITLTIVDNYNCNSSYAQQVSIYPHNLGGGITETTICGEANIDFSLPFPNPDNKVSPYYYNWSTDTTTLHPIDNITVYETGAYWLEVADNHGCTADIGLVVVDIPNTPSAIITGPSQVCFNESYTISGPGGSSLSYQWFYFDGFSWGTTAFATTQNVQAINSWAWGRTVKYKLLLTYTDPQTLISCVEESDALEVEWLAKPPSPTLKVDSSCELPINIYLQDPNLLNDYTVNWSNGATNVPNIISNHYGFHQATLIDSNSVFPEWDTAKKK